MEGCAEGKAASYYFHPAFWPFYIKRILWTLLNLITLRISTYKTFYRIISTQYFPHLMQPNYRNNRVNELIRTLFGLRFFYLKNLKPAYPGKYILKHKNISFEKTEAPLVSIIIPVFNNISYTYNCLLSIKENVSQAINYEIIVIDDRSTDETPQFLRNNSDNITYVRNENNLGFLKSNNKAIKYARGKYICLLNNDTEVQPGWLESMIELLGSSNTIGAVGSKLIYPNNILQEAGGVIFNDASGANVGKMDNSAAPDYNFIREVDYCSAASLLLRKDDFDSLGGFDEQFAPAYYEDTDLCFSIRNTLQKKVMYTPLSVVVHFEGISSGKEIKTGSVKYFQEINRGKFLSKWKIFLSAHDEGRNEMSFRRFLPSQAILIVDWSLPEFDKDSGSLRLSRIIKLIQSLGYHVLFAPGYGSVQERRYYQTLIKSGVEVRPDLNYYSPPEYFTSVCTRLKITLLWICRPTLTQLYEDKIRALKANNGIIWIYDTIDLHHLRMQREAQTLNSGKEQMAEAEEMKKLEIRLSQSADISITVTDQEKSFFEKNNAKKVFVVPNVHIIEPANGFKPFSERSGLLFIGGYSHTPNVDAAKWLIKDIMPAVWKKIPEVPVYLLGSHPTAEVLQLSADNVFVPGYIEDVSSFFFNSRIFVAPLRYGAGMKGKLGQSFEFRLPVVSTSIGAEGMNLENEKHLLIADSAIDLATQIIRLYKDCDLWDRLSKESTSAIQNYSEDHVSQSLKEVLT